MHYLGFLLQWGDVGNTGSLGSLKLVDTHCGCGFTFVWPQSEALFRLILLHFLYLKEI